MWRSKRSQLQYKLENLSRPNMLGRSRNALSLSGVCPKQHGSRNIGGSSRAMRIEVNAVLPTDRCNFLREHQEPCFASSLEPLACFPSPFPFL
eukprot:727907-Amphidinium_carterae.1